MGSGGSMDGIEAVGSVVEDLECGCIGASRWWK